MFVVSEHIEHRIRQWLVVRAPKGLSALLERLRTGRRAGCLGQVSGDSDPDEGKPVNLRDGPPGSVGAVERS